MEQVAKLPAIHERVGIDPARMFTNLYANRTTAKVQNELFEGYSDELLTFASTACIIFVIIGVPGNLLTIVALSRGKQTRNSTAVFIINLSLSDLLFGCFNLPLAASTFMERSWSHSDMLCRLFPLLRYGLLAVSLITVSLITINRYIIIAHPRQYPRIYQRRYLALMVAGTWIACFSIMIPTWREIWGKFGLDTEIGSCSILHDKYDRSPKEFLFVTAFMVPCLCIVFCYARIFYLVRKAAFRTREQPPAKNISTVRTEPTTTVTTSAKNSRSNRKDIALLQPEATDNAAPRPFIIDDDIEFIDVSDSNDSMPISYNNRSKSEMKASRELAPSLKSVNNSDHNVDSTLTDATKSKLSDKLSSSPVRANPTKTSLKTSFTRFNSRKSHYVSMGNTSNASSIYPGRMSQKDRRLLKMILVIFIMFVICYLPITVTKIWRSAMDTHIVNISGYLLIYLTTCVNPLIYVLMSSEYRQAYWSLLRCQSDQKQKKDAARNLKT